MGVVKKLKRSSVIYMDREMRPNRFLDVFVVQYCHISTDKIKENRIFQAATEALPITKASPSGGA